MVKLLLMGVWWAVAVTEVWAHAFQLPVYIYSLTTKIHFSDWIVDLEKLCKPGCKTLVFLLSPCFSGSASLVMSNMPFCLLGRCSQQGFAWGFQSWVHHWNYLLAQTSRSFGPAAVKSQTPPSVWKRWSLALTVHCCLPFIHNSDSVALPEIRLSYWLAGIVGCCV